MPTELSEIRLNEYYAIHSFSEYPGHDAKEDSKPKINKRVIRSEVFFDKIKDLGKNDNIDYHVDHLFPPNCRYYEKHKNGYFVVIEEDPAFRTVLLNKDISNEIESLKSLGLIKKYGYEEWIKTSTKPHRFTLAMPYVVFFFSYAKNHDFLNGRVFFRPKPISGFSDILFKAPFPNISDSQNVCFGDLIYKGPRRSIVSSVQHSINTFWGAEFNTDYIYNYQAYKNTPGLCDWITWEYYSNTDPMFVYTADWIQEKGITVGTEVERQRSHVEDRDERDRQRRKYSFASLRELFKSSRELGETKVPGVSRVDTLLYDVCQSMIFEFENIAVGDSLRDNKKRLYYIDSYLGFRRMMEPTHVSLQREDGRIIKMRITKKVRSYIENAIKEIRYIANLELKTGDIVKAGDIIKLKNVYGNDIHRKVMYIRENAAGEVEIRAGSEYYVASNLPEDTTVLDLSKPEYFGVRLVIGNEYIVLRNSEDNTPPILQVAKCKFKEVTTDVRQNLAFKLEETEGGYKGYVYKIPMNQTNTIQRVYDMSTIRELPIVFRVGRKLMWAFERSSSVSRVAKHAYCVDGMTPILYYRGTSVDRAPKSQYLDHPENKIVKDGKFSIAASDLDIEFSIGDKVVVANWQNPIDMLTVKQIQGFVEDRDNGDISFALSDKNGNLTNHPYVNGRKASIAVGSIRKITNTWKDLKAGMKITAKQAGISMFPKKDTYIIAGFLYDTGGPEPLVLCSNACTLWYSDVIEKFDIIKMEDEEWKIKKHASINPSRLRYQAGDILNAKTHFKNGYGFLTYKPEESQTIRAAHLGYYNACCESYVFDRGFTNDVYLDCFPNPRMTAKQETRAGFVHAYPNFHGMFTVTSQFKSPYTVINEPRSLLNVSSDN